LGTFKPLHDSPKLVVEATGFKAAASIDAGTEVRPEALGLFTSPPVSWPTAASDESEATEDLQHTKTSQELL